jgi:hypothetical protein
MSRRLCLHTIAALLALSIGIAKADTFNTFSIGNSLTVDSNIQVLTDLGAAKGITVSAAQAIHSGVGLDFLWSNPTQLDTGTSYTTGLANTLNAVTLEPFISPLAGTTGDAARTVDFMNFAQTANPANVNTQFYIFARWSEQSTWNPAVMGTNQGYDHQWSTLYDPNDTTFGTTETGDYFNKLITAVRASQPTNMKPIELIPTGFVFDAIDKTLTNGGLTGLAAAGGMPALYRDNLHLSELGQFIASTTFYATILHENPIGMTPPSEFPGLDTQTVSDLEKIIWNTVTTTADTGVSVPEPTSLALLSIVAACAMRRRR